MEVSQKYHKIPIFVFFLFRKIGAKVESGKVIVILPKKKHVNWALNEQSWGID